MGIAALHPSYMLPATDEFVSGQRLLPLAEKAEYSHDYQSGADHVNDGRETSCRMQIRSLNGSFRSARIAVDDDLPIEIAIGLQPVSQASADQESAEDDETGKPQENQQQHRKYAEKKDRQQRQQQQCLGLSSHRTTNRDSNVADFSPCLRAEAR
jgi:hypothetical protein